MPSVRINDGDLPSGTGVEGARKKKDNGAPAPTRREPESAEKVERSPGKSRHTRPHIGGDDGGADIFYTGTK